MKCDTCSVINFSTLCLRVLYYIHSYFQ